jgi:hypothetical protein
MAFRSDPKLQFPAEDTKKLCSGMIMRTGLTGGEGLKLSVVQAFRIIRNIFRLRPFWKAYAMSSSDDGSLFSAVI